MAAKIKTDNEQNDNTRIREYANESQSEGERQKEAENGGDEFYAMGTHGFGCQALKTIH